MGDFGGFQARRVAPLPRQTDDPLSPLVLAHPKERV